MARVYEQKARNDIYRKGLRTPADNKQGYKLDSSKPADENDVVVIKKGEKYYSWTLYGQATRISSTYPKRQQLTSSDFLITVYDLEDRLSDVRNGTYETMDDIKTEVESIIDEINTLKDETQEKRDNMPEQLQETGSGEMLGQRVDDLDSWVSDLEGIDYPDFEKDEEKTDEQNADALYELMSGVFDEIEGFTYGGS